MEEGNTSRGNVDAILDGKEKNANWNTTNAKYPIVADTDIASKAFVIARPDLPENFAKKVSILAFNR